MATKTDIAARLTEHLKDLHLPTIRECFAGEAERARKGSLSYEAYLLELISQETEDRKQRKIERFLRESKLPLEKNLDTFEMDRMPAKVKSQVSVLLEGSFVDRCDNVLAFGNVGSGKSHLLSAIGQELIYEQQRRVYFAACSILVQDLLVAKRELKLKSKLKNLDRFEIIYVDDIGYVQHDREEMEVLFSLLAHRYERRSVMITSNLPFSKWEAIFKDPMTTAAAIDRLVHHSVILELNIPSYRLEHSGESGGREVGGKDGGKKKVKTTG
ncbi:MAG: IS21-like element helper ATPase IstB [Actinomycetia bacterium]|nr:IS21-like element helper ATPase IstB [Actinomycetes bacterium]